MDQSLKVTNIKTEPTELSLIDQLNIPTDKEIQLNSVKQESVCLDQSEIYLKTEPKENEYEFPVIAGTSYEMCLNYDSKNVTEEPLINIKCKGIESEIILDPLNVNSKIEVEEQFPIDLDQDEPRIRTEPTKESKDKNLLESGEYTSQGIGSYQGQNQLLVRNDSDRKDKKYFCIECHKTFPGNWHLENHLRVHTGEKPYTCDICEKSFSEKGHLTTHMLIHSGEKPHSCGVCSKVFRHKSTLNEHKLMHRLGKKPFTCDVCNKSFTNKTNLVAHNRIHTGEKPYSCDVCEKAFAHKPDLIKHKRIHTGEKPYSCDICIKSFAQKSHLNKHKKIHLYYQLHKV